jgi:amidophosphoribosyltransferase
MREECGVFGIREKSGGNVALSAYYALYALQHRGQESAGIAVNDDGVITSHRDLGLVGEVFTPENLKKLGKGKTALGHCRYSTTGAKTRRNAQPLVISHIKGGLALAHNGNLTNASELREKLELEGAIFHATSDSEVIAYMITKARLREPSIEDAISRAMESLNGAYCLTVMSPSKLIAARDPNGFRPLCMGETKDGGIVFASESCAIDAIGGKFIRDVAPGEIIVASDDGVKSISKFCGARPSSLCVFEFIYFARPDSVIENSSVHIARQRAGAFLALSRPVQADVVIGVPDSGIDAALGYAKQSGIPYDIGFLKNKYMGRTFISPDRERREIDVRIKLNPIAATVKDKRVVLVDDSIVRGTTSQRIVKLLRDAGAREIHMRLSSPPFLYPCYFGTDVESSEGLIAHNHTIDEIRDIINVDSLGYLETGFLDKLADNSSCGFCKACFTGVYPVDVPEKRHKLKFETKLKGDNESDAKEGKT